MKIEKIYEEKYILDYLQDRNLTKQYKKSKKNILSWMHTGNRLKYREPKQERIIYFRINRQFRALCRLVENKKLVVFDIDKHQK